MFRLSYNTPLTTFVDHLFIVIPALLSFRCQRKTIPSTTTHMLLSAMPALHDILRKLWCWFIFQSYHIYILASK